LSNNRLSLIGLIIGILIWYGLSLVIKSAILPSPFIAVYKIKELFIRKSILNDIGISFIRLFAGVILGSFFGLIVGFLLATFKKLFSLFDPWIQLLRPISPFAFLPLLILILGLGTIPVIFIIFLGTFLPMTIIIRDALRNIDKEYLDTAALFGAAGVKRAYYVELPLILPVFLSSLRVFFGVGFILVIGGEMLSTNSGLGFRLMSARYLLDFPELYALIIIIGIIGYSLDLIMRNLIKDYSK
jgi:NitT/TauT family transport system permease protein